ncbi:MAG: hypothetical protein H6716_17185 [Polyangiaceae bacterium]|nr:hypothetical protein [Polyangiaceae bacterium]
MIPKCVITDDSLAVFVEIPEHTTITNEDGSVEDSDDRKVWYWRCDLETGDCHGASLRLGAVDQGKPLSFFDLGDLANARLVSLKGKVVTMEWGPFRTFTFDFATRKVAYVQSATAEQSLSGRASETRGIGDCGQDD